jgi:hypothetical protein
MTTSEFNTEFGKIAGENKEWDFEITSSQINITKNGEVKYTAEHCGSNLARAMQKEQAIAWFKRNFK